MHYIKQTNPDKVQLNDLDGKSLAQLWNSYSHGSNVGAINGGFFNYRRDYGLICIAVNNNKPEKPNVETDEYAEYLTGWYNMGDTAPVSKGTLIWDATANKFIITKLSNASDIAYQPWKPYQLYTIRLIINMSHIKTTMF